MFTEEELLKMAIKICDEYNIFPYPRVVRYNNRISKVFGRCFTEKQIIELGTTFCETNSDEIVIALLKHECGHLKYPNHGLEFTILQRKMGQKTHIQETFDVIVPFKWKYTCPNCGFSYRTFNKEHKIFLCSKCYRKYNENYTFICNKL